MDTIAFPCQTIRLDHVLIDPNIGGSVPIAHDDCDDRRRRRLRRRARASAEPPHQAALAPRIVPPLSTHETLHVEGAQEPPKAIYARVIKDGRPCAISDGSGSGGHGDCRLMAFAA